MTLIVGQDGTGWSNLNDLPQTTGFDAVWFTGGYTPSFNGDATTAKVNIPDWSSATKGKVLVYRASDGVLLATSAEFVPADGTGLLSKSITLNGITTGVALKLAWLTDNYCYIVKDNGASNFSANQDPMTYATPDDPLPAGTNLGPEFIIWLDGSAGGGGGVTLMGAMCL